MSEKVLLITNIPTPYRIPLFNEMNRVLRESGMDFEVLFGALGYARRKWHVDLNTCEFPYSVLTKTRTDFTDAESSRFSYSGLSRRLAESRPSVIVTNGFSVATSKLWLRSWFDRTPYLIWSGETQRKGRPMSRLRTFQRRLLVRRADGFIAYGTKAKEYLLKLGADPAAVQIAINTVDTEYFVRETCRLRKEMDGEPRTRRLLYVGNLTEGKRIDHLLLAAKTLANQRSDFVLELVGTGSAEAALKQMVTDLGLGNRVSFEGFKQRDEVIGYLARADCFLFPSEYDIWGLVLVEAMSAGLPCVSSIHAGATQDLIEDGVTGFALDFARTDVVADRLSWLLDHPENAHTIGRRAMSFIREKASLTASASGFVQAIREALALVNAKENSPVTA